MPYADVQAALNSIRGLARPNRFVVDMFWPGGKVFFDTYAESVDIPSLSVGTADFQYNTQPLLKIPYAKLPAQTCNITFRLDSAGNPVGRLYDHLQNGIVKNVGGDFFMAYLEEISGTIDIACLSPLNDTKLFTIKLTDTILTNIDTVQLSYDDRDSYLKQTVTFAYRDASITGPSS